MKKSWMGLAGILGSFMIFTSSLLFGSNVLVRMPNDESFVMRVPDKLSVKRLMKKIEQWADLPVETQLIISDGRICRSREILNTYDGQEFLVELKSRGLLDADLIAKASYAGYRIYDAPLERRQKEDIQFILKTLATNSPPALLFHRNKLLKAGARIDKVHPLKFLLTVFTDNEMKAHIAYLSKQKGLIWKDFMDGLGGSLRDESEIGNMKTDYINDFSQKLGISAHTNQITKLIQAFQWDKLVRTLIAVIPRDGDSGRYEQ